MPQGPMLTTPMFPAQHENQLLLVASLMIMPNSHHPNRCYKTVLSSRSGGVCAIDKVCSSSVTVFYLPQRTD